MRAFLTRALAYTVVSTLMSVGLSVLFSHLAGWSGLVPSVVCGMILGWGGVKLAQLHTGYGL